MSTAETAANSRRGRRLLVLVPLLAFMAIAAVFLAQLWSGRDAAQIPSALIGRPAPAMTLPPLAGAGLPGLDTAALKGGPVTVVNVFASWCKPCELEHPQLMRLKADPRIRVVAINYKDTDENARRFLARFGNPYAAIGADPKGRAAIDWGVYGIPETFVIGADGRIAYKQIGPIDPATLETRIRPAIEDALKAR